MRATLTIALILLSASPSEARAICSQSSMTGTWIYTGVNLQNIAAPQGRFQNGRSLLERCEFDIDSGGTIVDVSCDDENSISEDEFEGSTFTIFDSCSIALRTIACGPTGLPLGPGLYFGQLSRDRNVASGSAQCGAVFSTPAAPGMDIPSDLDSNFFNLVKQPD